MVILEILKLCKSFGGVAANKNLDLTVNEKEILGLIGPNGSGKTTLFNLITGYEKVDSGTIKFKGRDITYAKCHERCVYGIARTFQLAKPFGALTALQNVAAGRLYGREPAQSMKQAAEEAMGLLDVVGLKGKERTIAGNLILVDRRKLEVARALAVNPELLLLDEVIAGLSAVESESFLTFLEEIIKTRGLTVIMVEHILKTVLDMSDRIIVLNTGEKIADCPPEEVIHNKLVVDAYLGGPVDA